MTEKARLWPQLCFHGTPDTEPCERCNRFVVEKPVEMKPGAYYRAEVIDLTPQDSQYILDCEAKVKHGVEEMQCTNKARHLGAWWSGLNRKRRRLCPVCVVDFRKIARVKA